VSRVQTVRGTSVIDIRRGHLELSQKPQVDGTVGPATAVSEGQVQAAADFVEVGQRRVARPVRRPRFPEGGDGLMESWTLEVTRRREEGPRVVARKCSTCRWPGLVRVGEGEVRDQRPVGAHPPGRLRTRARAPSNGLGRPSDAGHRADDVALAPSQSGPWRPAHRRRTASAPEGDRPDGGSGRRDGATCPDVRNRPRDLVETLPTPAIGRLSVKTSSGRHDARAGRSADRRKTRRCGQFPLATAAGQVGESRRR